MRELDGDEQVVRRAELFLVKLQDAGVEPGELVDVAFVDPELAGVGAAVAADGGGFKPDEFGAAESEAFVTAPGKLVGVAVERGVAAFHGMDGHGVAEGDGIADAHLAAENGFYCFRVGFKPDKPGAGLSVLLELT